MRSRVTIAPKAWAPSFPVSLIPTAGSAMLRVKTARRVKTTYRARRSFGLSATDARKAAHEKRVACALASNLPTFYVEA